MSETVLIALIGIIPSLIVALVTIISNNEVLKRRIESVEWIASEYHHYEEELLELKQHIATCESQYLGLVAHIDRLEHRKNSRGRTHI